MKTSALALAAAGFGIAVLIVNAGGHRLLALEAPSVDVIDESDLPADMSGDDNFDQSVSDTPEIPGIDGADALAPEPGAAAVSPDEQGALAPAPARTVAQGEIAPPTLDQGALVREAPRAPLSDLSLALPPKPKVTAEWDGATLFRPLATAAGVIEANGVTVTIAGVTPLDIAETCSDDGKEWNCGVRARTALRGMLRGRAVVCDVPEGEAKGDIVARCRIGKLDVGQWLVANGWARAAGDGPYADIGEKAVAGKKGIFGAPPERIEMTLTPNATSLPQVAAPPTEPMIETPAQ